MPIFPAIGVAIALIAAWVQFDPNTQRPPTAGPERYRGPFDVVLAAWALASLIGALSVVAGLAGAWPLAGLGALAFVALIAPWRATRAVLVPLGFARAAALVARWSMTAWRGDPRGGALVAALLASMPRGGPDPALRAWLEAWFGAGVLSPEPDAAPRFSITMGAGGVFQAATEASSPMLGGAAVAVGLLDAAAGQTDAARGVFEAVGWFDERVRPEAAATVARRWLTADAIARGAWGQAGAVPGTADASTFLGRLAARTVAGPPEARPMAWELWLAVALSGRPALVGLVRHALSASPDVAAAPPRPAEALPGALAAHVAALDDPRPARIRAAAAAWDAVRADGAVAKHIALRAAALGCSAEARDRVLAAVEADLATLIVERGLEVGAIDGPTLAAASGAVRDRAVADCEALAEGLGSRVRAKRWSCSADELREWVGVKQAYERVGRLGGEAARRVVFVVVHQHVCAQAVWLWNERGQKPLANAIFRWLLEEARQLSAEDLVRLQTKNVACGP